VASERRKYAKWKAAYIHNCLKSGQTPVAGPLATGEDQEEEGQGMDQEQGQFLLAISG
jgi:vacuolar protein sorting-associated protein VTA1